MQMRQPDAVRDGTEYYVNVHRREYRNRTVPFGILLSVIGGIGLSTLTGYILLAFLPGFDNFNELVFFTLPVLVILMIYYYPYLGYMSVPVEVGLDSKKVVLTYASGDEDVFPWKEVLLVAPYPVPTRLETRDRFVRLEDVDPEILVKLYQKWKTNKK